MKVLVSACLLGKNCKYNGKNNYHEGVISFLKGKEVVEVCPEQLGGLPTPRACSECVNDRVMNTENQDVTSYFLEGAEKALEIALNEQVDLAILQARSPSCGVGKIYDGSFSKVLIDGDGIFVKSLKKAGISVKSSEQF